MDCLTTPLTLPAFARAVTPRRDSLARSMRRALLTCFAALLVALGAPAATAQTTPKVGDWFEERADMGFRVKTPKDWTFVPPNMGDPINLAKYVPKGRDWIPLKGDAQLWVFGWVMRFDLVAYQKSRGEMLRRLLGLEAGEEIPADEWEEIDRDDLILDWLTNTAGQATGWALVERKERKSGRDIIEERIYEGTMSWNEDTFPVRVYMALLPVGQDRWAGVAFNGYGEKGEWKKAETAFSRIGRTLEALEIEAAKEAVAADGGAVSMRDEKRAALEKEVARLPGWWLHETPNYFILTDSRAKDFIEELGDRLEAIRAVYETDYPYTMARSYERPGESRPETEEGEEGADDDEEPDRSTSAGRNSFELSRTSVVRVCSDSEMYHEYGGPYGSAGYWSSYHQELVVYDDQKGGGRGDTWSVVNHEAFHQYIFYFYGNIAPHSWYNEGTGDFYAGYEYNTKRKRFTLTPFDWRKSLAKDCIRQKKFAPLREFVRWTQREYYGSNQYGLGGGENYALGWSFIWFLRTGKEKAKGWDPAWDGILDTYLAELANSGNLDKAVDAAFAGVDWEKLQETWVRYCG